MTEQGKRLFVVPELVLISMEGAQRQSQAAQQREFRNRRWGGSKRSSENSCQNEEMFNLSLSPVTKNANYNLRSFPHQISTL